MYNKKMYNLGASRSVIRELFEYGNMLKSQIGEDKVFDFTLGNPSVPTPSDVNECIKRLVDTDLSIHAYTSAPGNLSTRKAIADYLSTTHGVEVDPTLMYMTTGAAAALTITLNAIVESPDDEILAIAPFFPEYRVFSEGAGAKFGYVEMDEEGYQIDFEKLEAMLTPNTRAVIINSPNNPSGIVYSEDTLIKLSSILTRYSEQYSHPIILIADEPYREVIFGDVVVPYPMKYYKDTVVCYSYSKSLCLPGERIGYIAVSPSLTEAQSLYLCICGAGRSLGYVCASSLFQKVIENTVGLHSDNSVYQQNRDILINELSSLGLKCANPDGAFYLLVKVPDGDSIEFANKAKQLGLLIVPADSFGAKGYVRIATCVSTDMVRRSIPYFQKLMEMYR